MKKLFVLVLVVVQAMAVLAQPTATAPKQAAQATPQERPTARPTPQTPPVDTLKQAQYYRSVMKFDEAIALLSAAQGSTTLSKEALELLADCYVQSGRMSQAQEAYQSLLEQEPENLSYRVKLMQIYYRTKDYKRCLGESGEIIRRDSIPAVLNIRGDAFNNLGRKDSALVCYRKVLHLKPTNESAATKAGKILLDAKEYGRAVELADAFLAVDSLNQVVQSIKGVALFMKKDYEQSFDIFRKQVEEGRDDFSGYYYLGMSASHLGLYFEAEESLQNAFKCDTTRVDVPLAIADCKNHRNLPLEEVQYWLDKALALLEPDPGLLSQSYQLYATAYINHENKKEGLKWYKKALEIDPDNQILILNTAYTYDSVKDYKNAVPLYEKFLSKCKPGTPAARYVEISLKHARAELFMEEPAGK